MIYFILQKLGYYPESLLNYITVHGGGFSKSDNEVLSLEELVKNVSQIKKIKSEGNQVFLFKINKLYEIELILISIIYISFYLNVVDFFNSTLYFQFSAWSQFL
jgi:hypothetical protein